MRIKYFGNMKDDNGNIRENTRIGVIYFKDSEEDKCAYICRELEEEGYKFTFIGDDGDGLNEYWFSVEDREDFDNLKDIYLESKRKYTKEQNDEPTPEQSNNTPETECEQLEDVPMPEHSDYVMKSNEIKKVTLTKFSNSENFDVEYENGETKMFVAKYERYYVVFDNVPENVRNFVSLYSDSEKCVYVCTLFTIFEYTAETASEQPEVPAPVEKNEKPDDVPETASAEISSYPLDVPFDMRMKSLCKKCKHLESCFNNDRSKVLEDVHCSPCDDVCGECTACCSHFKQDFKEICVNCRSCIHFRKCLASDKVYWCHLDFDSSYHCFACETDDIECIGKYLDCYQNEFEYFDYSELETEEVINDGDLPF